jgi:ribosomal protein S18 acetylase RimI-like enzyme
MRGAVSPSGSISVCSPEQLSEVADLVNAAYRGEGGQVGWTSEAGIVDGRRTTRSALQEDLAAAGHVSLLTLRDGGRLLACLRLELEYRAGGQRVCHIGMLAVHPGAQDRGLGRALLRHAEEAGMLAGARAARLTVVSIRGSLIAWYERQGYLRTGERQQFPYEDARFGTALRPDLEFIVLEKPLRPRPTETSS